MSLRPTIETKKRSEIEKQIEEYLKRGGTITVLPTGPTDGQREHDVDIRTDDSPDRSEGEGEDPFADQAEA